MRTSKFSKSKRLAIVKEYGSTDVDTICKKHGISPQTFYKWKKDFEIESDVDKKRLRDLERENELLKKMYVDVQLEKSILEDALDYAKKLSALKQKTN